MAMENITVKTKAGCNFDFPPKNLGLTKEVAN
jgi:hypothetical protein